MFCSLYSKLLHLLKYFICICLWLIQNKSLSQQIATWSTSNKGSQNNLLTGTVASYVSTIHWKEMRFRIKKQCQKQSTPDSYKIVTRFLNLEKTFHLYIVHSTYQVPKLVFITATLHDHGQKIMRKDIF